MIVDEAATALLVIKGNNVVDSVIFLFVCTEAMKEVRISETSDSEASESITWNVVRVSKMMTSRFT